MRCAAFCVIGALIVVGATAAAGLAVPGVQPLPLSYCSPVAFSGSGSPDLLVVSDLPVYGRARQGTVADANAIRSVFEQHRFRAGKYTVGYQSCDDSNPQDVSGDLSKCAANAKMYADDPSVVAVIGTWSSACSEVEIPITNSAPGGPIVMVSPTNTLPGLTHGAPGTAPGQPRTYYPTGTRSFARLIVPDDAQGAAAALLAKELRARPMFLLDDRESYGIGVAAGFSRAAELLDVPVAGRASWDPNATAFSALVATVRRAHAAGVFLAGLECPHCDRLIEALRAALGPSGPIVVSDGFYLPDLINSAGAAANGLYGTLDGLPASKLTAAGTAVAKRFGAGVPDSGGPPYAAQAAEVILAAIAASNGSRASVTAHTLDLHVRAGLLGSFRFDANGDIDPGGVTIDRVVAGHVRLDRTVLVPTHLVHARGV